MPDDDEPIGPRIDGGKPIASALHLTGQRNAADAKPVDARQIEQDVRQS